jgi:hypothetical protein
MRRLAAPAAFVLSAVLGAVPGAGCGAPARYARDRLLDLTDVVDFKYGRAMGLGAKVEATLWLGAGVGAGVVDISREWYGRHASDFDREGRSPWTGEGLFLHAGIVGLDGGSTGNLAQSAINTGLLNAAILWWSGGPPTIDRFRFGAEGLLPGALGGLYLNTGQFWDLLVGVAGFDPADDDGLAKQ